jgi:hypothetical protein
MAAAPERDHLIKGRLINATALNGVPEPGYHWRDPDAEREAEVQAMVAAIRARARQRISQPRRRGGVA